MATEIKKDESLEKTVNGGATLYLFKSEIEVDCPGYLPRILFRHQDPDAVKMMHQEMLELFKEDLQKFMGRYFF
ncbi:MAG: hypothetical protein Q8N22_01760 [bacterium]|nr:hypothetical protein [bacterium]